LAKIARPSDERLSITSCGNETAGVGPAPDKLNLEVVWLMRGTKAILQSSGRHRGHSADEKIGRASAFSIRWRLAAENIPGVVRVDDHLVWLEPVTGIVVEAPKD
jgi:hypothetical protein